MCRRWGAFRLRTVPLFRCFHYARARRPRPRARTADRGGVHGSSAGTSHGPNREWRVDIHVSRQVVLHTATLGASGCFLLAVAVVGMLLRRFGGDWGLVLQLAMLFGSIVVLGTVLSSGSVRRRLKFLISRNFFTHRYDYRVEWLKFIELVSEPKHAEELPVRIIRALAEFVDSSAGVLWSLSRGIGYYPTAAWR